MISAVLLAAGESRRMGEFKQLLPLGDKSFVQHCVDNLLASHVSEVVVVTGHREADVRHTISDRRVKFAHNAEFQSGMSSSIKRGIMEVSAHARGCLIALVDQPWIGTSIINLIIEKFDRSQALVVVPTSGGKAGHPILLDISLREEILAMDANQGLRTVVQAHLAESVRVEVPDYRVLEDCDFPEDYDRMLKI